MTAPPDYPPDEQMERYAQLLGLAPGTPEHNILRRVMRNSFEDGVLYATPDDKQLL